MKKIIALFILALSMMQVSAKSVVFTLSNGTLVYYLLGGDTNPVMKFVDGKVVVNADTYEISGIKNFYISETDDPTMISTVTARNTVSYNGNTFVVKGKTSQVKVFSVNGTEAETPVTENDDNTYINMGSLQKGTYVVKVGETSFKVMKK